MRYFAPQSSANDVIDFNLVSRRSARPWTSPMAYVRYGGAKGSTLRLALALTGLPYQRNGWNGDRMGVSGLRGVDSVG